MVERSGGSGDEVNEQFVMDLIEFGFGEYEARLALKVSRNDKE